MKPARIVSALLLALTIVAGCSDDPAAPEILQLIKNLGDAQSGRAGVALTVAPSVKVTNSSGAGVAGVPVSFAVASGGGSVTGGTQTTGADGVATVGSWVLGSAVGANTLTATSTDTRVQGGPVTFTATGTTGPAAAVAKTAGDNQSARVGTAVTTVPAVRVNDAFGNPVAGATVTFTVGSGGGAVAGGTQTTAAGGTASPTSWTLGNTAGAQTLVATVTGTGITGSPATFTATATAGAAANLSKTAGDNGTGTVGAAVATVPTVRATDQFGNPVAGVTVTFGIASGGGTVVGGTQTTGADGTARPTSWTLGTVAGANTLTATATGTGIAGSPATFTVTAAAGPATQISKVEGDAQTAPAGGSVGVAPQVRVLDAHGNRVAGAAVRFTVTQGGGSVTGGDQTTGADGQARVGAWTLGPAGPQSLSATVTTAGFAGTPVVFTATANLVVPTAMAKVAGGDNQTATVNTAVAVAPAVLLTDAGGNPVAGVLVNFTVQTGGGAVTGGAATSGADGIARVGSWTLGTTAGANNNTLRAQAMGTGIADNPATFTASSTAGVAATITVVAGTNNQTANAGAAVAVRPAVRAVDAFGNLVGGLPVAFAVATGGGAVAGGNQTTGADGVATVGSWTLGAAPGQNTMTATATGTGIAGNPITFIATGQAFLNLEPYRGTYNGTWTNTTFSSTGGATFTVEPLAGNQVRITFSASGNVLGSGSSAAQTRTVPYTNTGASGTDTLNDYGTVTLNITPVSNGASGNFTLSATGVGGGIDGWTANGTITPSRIDLNFTIQFSAGSGGGTASGNSVLTK